MNKVDAGDQQAECSVVLHRTAHTVSGERDPAQDQSRYDTVIGTSNGNNILVLYSVFIVNRAWCCYLCCNCYCYYYCLSL